VAAAGDAPEEVAGFTGDMTAADGFVMPATQHDAVLWLSGSASDVIFDVARDAIAELRELASVVEETSSWPYRHDRDSLTHYTRPLTGAYYFVRSTDALRRRFEP
jgi:deferrochelatase/peroxidase EfeB